LQSSGNIKLTCSTSKHDISVYKVAKGHSLESFVRPFNVSLDLNRQIRKGKDSFEPEEA